MERKVRRAYWGITEDSCNMALMMRTSLMMTSTHFPCCGLYFLHCMYWSESNHNFPFHSLFLSVSTVSVALTYALLGQDPMWSYLGQHRTSPMCMTSKLLMNRCTTTWSARTRSCIPCTLAFTHTLNTALSLPCFLSSVSYSLNIHWKYTKLYVWKHAGHWTWRCMLKFMIL